MFNYIFVIVRVLSIVLFLITLFTGHWLGTFNAFLTLFVSFLPNILYKKWNIIYPNEIVVTILLFVVFSLIFGEIFDFYYKFALWDVILHTLSGVVIAMFSFIMIKQLNENIDVRVTLSPFFTSLFAVSFALAIGVFLGDI